MSWKKIYFKNLLVLEKFLEKHDNDYTLHIGSKFIFLTLRYVFSMFRILVVVILWNHDMYLIPIWRKTRKNNTLKNIWDIFFVKMKYFIPAAWYESDFQISIWNLYPVIWDTFSLNRIVVGDSLTSPYLHQPLNSCSV